jgi:hypothetical protein
MDTVDAATAADQRIELLARQLERMRGMLAAYSAMFFAHMRLWGVVTVGLLVASSWQPLGAAAGIIPFLLPYVFLEASYLFWYTVFARRHAEWVERAIDARLGEAVLVAHRLEAAYFYPPDRPRISALSLARPLSHMSAATAGYTGAAGLAWVAGLLLWEGWLAEHGGGDPLPAMVTPAALAWTAAIVAYLLWFWLRNPDERRLVAALESGYANPSAGPVDAHDAEPPSRGRAGAQGRRPSGG